MRRQSLPLLDDHTLGLHNISQVCTLTAFASRDKIVEITVHLNAQSHLLLGEAGVQCSTVLFSLIRYLWVLWAPVAFSRGTREIVFITGELVFRAECSFETSMGFLIWYQSGFIQAQVQTPVPTANCSAQRPFISRNSFSCFSILITNSLESLSSLTSVVIFFFLLSLRCFNSAQLKT